MKRKLAVPLALWEYAHRENREFRTRKLRTSSCDEDDLCLFRKLADNRERLERLRQDIECEPVFEECDEFKNEMDFIKANIQLGLLELTGELEEIKSSDEIFEEAIA